MELCRQTKKPKREGVIGCSQGHISARNLKSICIRILRQYNHNVIREKIWWNDFKELTKYLRKIMEALFGYKYEAKYLVCTEKFEYSGCSNQVYLLEGMVPINGCLKTHRREFQQARKEVEELGEPVLLPSVEPDSADITEDFQRESNSNHSSFIVEICDMVPNSRKNGRDFTNLDTGRFSDKGPQKRKISTGEEQEVDLNRIEDQRLVI
ncbi:hypothetical protein AYI68_g5663 [Smittium mucronatum]|uniref:Uncharacterized protein n=1 Tax=Smittium mucronatum TaxID=133383 RepID=A0A1R0GTM9_9FUNG|nr:hypothetical protein AYI68_g5663 [Smittium mucronatum]